MTTIVTLETTRSNYSASDAALGSITVAELISMLEEQDPDAKVVFSNDNGYTFGSLNWSTIGEAESED